MTTDICPLCDEAIEEWDVVWPQMPFYTEALKGAFDVHKECLLRSVSGGIGHWEDHEYWCVKMGDPDGGRSLRQSAREVAVLIRERGIAAMPPADAL
jgi:hypothetical protein